mmetsp:Transcript_26538/g.68913  ORF Transcript_26538/g.68913 Transcript_26538/m.68913 type:complete len:313 (+) Transcript_26538:3490-4428(+)
MSAVHRVRSPVKPVINFDAAANRFSMSAACVCRPVSSSFFSLKFVSSSPSSLDRTPSWSFKSAKSLVVFACCFSMSLTFAFRGSTFLATSKYLEIAVTQTNNPVPALLTLFMFSTVIFGFLKYLRTAFIIFSVIESFGYLFNLSNRLVSASIFLASPHVSSNFTPVGRRQTTIKQASCTSAGGLAKFFTSVMSSLWRFARADSAISRAGMASSSAASALPFSRAITTDCSEAVTCMTSASSFCLFAIVVFSVICSIKASTSTVFAETMTCASLSSMDILSTSLAASTSFDRPPANRFTEFPTFFSLYESCVW